MYKVKVTYFDGNVEWYIVYASEEGIESFIERNWGQEANECSYVKLSDDDILPITYDTYDSLDVYEEKNTIFFATGRRY